MRAQTLNTGGTQFTSWRAFESNKRVGRNNLQKSPTFPQKAKNYDNFMTVSALSEVM